MRKIVKASLSALLHLLILVILPNITVYYTYQMMPYEALLILENVVTPSTLILIASIMGVMLSVLAFIQNMTEEGTRTILLSQVASTVISFILFLYLIGLGNPFSFGVQRISVNFITILYDFHFFIYLRLILLVLNIAVPLIRFLYAKNPVRGDLNNDDGYRVGP
jgi:hypothetical protein